MFEHCREFANTLVCFAKIIGADKACLAYIRLGHIDHPEILIGRIVSLSPIK